ncbi:unnamed protein product [Parnassius apollo]|uniref:(apollo) hypothetical protein n=1 Tax=Parnassius apollo TaxID=110799 RepID=A0A8S3XGT6_PARAO|nr:unnamed protein product [Parnassius apollo]
MSGTPINSINIKHIKLSIEEKAHMVRKNICDEVKNKLIALKVDVASLKSRRFLGLNIQYIREGKIVLRNVGIMELHQRNTAEFLKDCVTFMLSRFGIEIKQLYSIKTDNGANMLSMVKKIDERVREAPEIFESLEDETDVDDTDYYQNLIDNLQFDLVSSEIIPKVTAVRCAAHTLQLAVRDALNEHVDLLDQWNVSYSSKTNCEELIELMSQEVRSVILAERRVAGYFSLSVDSTPDLSHIDQLCVIIRYVSPFDDLPVERFLTFLELNSRWKRYYGCGFKIFDRRLQT